MHFRRRSLRLILGAAMMVSAAGLLGGRTSASADSPGGVALADLPQCAGVTEGLTHVIDATRGIVSVEPPAHFNPLTAPAAQLTCYGFPPRPDGGAALQRWQHLVSAAQHYVVPEFSTTQVPQTPLQGSVCCSYDTHFYPNNKPPEYPWSGYAISRYKNGWTNLTWTEADAEWVVPYGHNYCYNSSTGASDSAWVGIGGDGWDGGGSGLIQGGTTTFDWPSQYANFWWYDWTTGTTASPTTITSLSVSPGNDVATYVTYETGNPYHTQFYYENLSTGGYTTWGDRYTPYLDFSSAEFINEDQPASWDFVNFGTVPFVSTSASGTWGSSNQYSITKTLSDSVTLSKFTAYKSGGDTSAHLVAWPTAVNSTGGFTDYATSNDGC